MGDRRDSKRRHEPHLCKLAKRGDIEQVRALVRDAAFICAKCGRVAREKDNLCDPARI